MLTMRENQGRHEKQKRVHFSRHVSSGLSGQVVICPCINGRETGKMMAHNHLCTYKRDESA